MLKSGDYYLITSDAYFIAPDGEQYRSAWGKCTIFTTEKEFGFTPAKPSTNWFLRIGDGENSVIVGGCQIHYAVKTSARPTFIEGTYLDDRTKVEMSINNIYYTK